VVHRGEDCRRILNGEVFDDNWVDTKNRREAIELKNAEVRVIQLTDDEATDPCPNPLVPCLFRIAIFCILRGDEAAMQADTLRNVYSGTDIHPCLIMNFGALKLSLRPHCKKQKRLHEMNRFWGRERELRCISIHGLREWPGEIVIGYGECAEEKNGMVQKRT
jgi:hypothetical protein